MEFEDNPIGPTVSALKRAFLENLVYTRGKHPRSATRHDYYMALAYTVRDRIVERWVSFAQDMLSDPSVVVYLSAEYLPGPPGGVLSRFHGHPAYPQRCPRYPL